MRWPSSSSSSAWENEQWDWRCAAVVQWEKSNLGRRWCRTRVVRFEALVTVITRKAIQIVEKKSCREVWKGTKIAYPDKIRITSKIVIRLSGHCSTVDVKPKKTFLTFNGFLVGLQGCLGGPGLTWVSPLCYKRNLSIKMMGDFEWSKMAFERVDLEVRWNASRPIPRGRLVTFGSNSKHVVWSLSNPGQYDSQERSRTAERSKVKPDRHVDLEVRWNTSRPIPRGRLVTFVSNSKHVVWSLSNPGQYDSQERSRTAERRKVTGAK